MTAPRVAHVCTVDLTARFLLLPQLRRLRDEGYDVSVISAPGRWVADLEAEGIRHLAWASATRAWDPRADRRAYRELRDVLGRERFDVVHTHNPKPGVLGRIAARRAGVPVVVNTVHGLYATPEDRWAKRAAILTVEGYAARFSDLELYQSAEDLAWARREGVVPASRSALLGNGTDLGAFHPAAVPPARVSELREELGLGPHDIVIGTVGRLVDEKGFRELFEAIRAVPGPIRLLVAGSRDADKDDALSEADLAAAGDRVVLAGWRPDVRDLYAAMDVFVLASWREGLPRSAVEAAAMGRPLVLTDIRGCREVARHEREGLLVPPRDPAALAAAIGRLARDEGLRHSLGAAARTRAEERFDERAVMDRIVGAYGALLTRRGILAPDRLRANGFRVRPGRPEDAPALARMHAEALPRAFLPLLGDRFMRRLYRAMVRDPQAVVVVAEEGTAVVGFASGVASVKAFYRRFYRRHGLPAALGAVPRLVRPGILRRIRETARYPAGARDLPQAELLSIAVEGTSRSKGVGRVLGEGIVAGLARRGADRVKVVVAGDNEGARTFYRRLGFEPLEEIEVHEGTTSDVLVRSCGS